MKIVGIVVEYNPFHTGHLNHINKVKALHPNSIVIAAMSGEVVQRGEFSIYNKWDRTETALEHGVDIVIQIPTYDVLNSAETFCSKSVEILNAFGVEEIIFGSETNNNDNLIKMADKIMEPNSKEEIAKLVKEMQSYPKAMESFLGETFNPNDILGISYIVAGKQINKDIKVHSIQRDRGEEYLSASRIRHNLRYEDGSATKFDLVKSNPRNMDWLIPIIKAKLVQDSNEPFVNYLQNTFKENNINTWNEFLEIANNKSFTKARVARETMKFVADIKQENSKIRVLGLSSDGRNYLRNNEDIEYTTKYLQEHENDLKISKLLDIQYKDSVESETKKTIVIK